MKVAFVSQAFDQVLPPEQNSVGIWTYEVARRLAEDGDVTVFARRPRGLAASAALGKAKLKLLTSAPPGAWTRGGKLWSAIRPRGGPLFAQRLYAFDYLAQVAWHLSGKGADIIHLQNFPHHVPALRRIFPRATIVLHMHCDWLVELDSTAMERGIAAADLVVGCSGHVVDRARERFGKLNIPFAVLPNGFSPERLTGSEGRRDHRSVVFAGRLSPEKGLHTLLAAWPRVVAAIPEARLQIIGPEAQTPREFLIDLSAEADVRRLGRFYPGGAEHKGSYADALRAMVPATLSDTVEFTDHIPHAGVLERIAGAGLLVNPSLSESFGMSLIEAIGSGTPVVATRVGGMPEIVDATQAGTLVPRDDPDALADAIVANLKQSHAEADTSRAAARAAALYGWSRIADLTREMHRKAVAERRARLAPQERPGAWGRLKNV